MAAVITGLYASDCRRTRIIFAWKRIGTLFLIDFTQMPEFYGKAYLYNAKARQPPLAVKIM